MSVPKIDITDFLNNLAIGLEEAAALQDAIALVAETDDCPASVTIMARLGRKLLDATMNQQIEISGWCFAMHRERIEREAAMANHADTDEGQALRDLASDMAQKIDAICHPAMRAITLMQNNAGEIDAMVRRARDMAGHLRWMQSPDRDPDKPEAGTLRHTVEQAMAQRPGSLSAIAEHRRATRDWMDRAKDKPGLGSGVDPASQSA